MQQTALPIIHGPNHYLTSHYMTHNSLSCNPLRVMVGSSLWVWRWMSLREDVNLAGKGQQNFHRVLHIHQNYSLRLAAARTKDAVVALELAAGECGSGAQPGLAQGDGTTPCQIAVNGRDPTLQFKCSID
jgi:hypothetical protein